MNAVTNYLDKGQAQLAAVAEVMQQIKAGATNVSDTVASLSQQ